MNTKEENKRERRMRLLNEHYQRCAALATKLGHANPNGRHISNKLWMLEKLAHNAATAQCNGEAHNGQQFRTEKQWETFKRLITGRVATTFGALPPGFFVNGDARGYALKIDGDHPEGKSLIEELRLERDWGGDGLLSPGIDGD